MSSKDINWWIWERPAQIHLIYSAAASATYPLVKEYGLGYASILYGFFSNNMVRWMCHMDAMEENGKQTLQKFLDQKYYDEVEQKRMRENKKLHAILERIRVTDLTQLSNQELLDLYNEYDETYINWWGVVQVAELIAYGGEAVLKERLTPEQFKQYFSLLVTPTKKSYTNREEEDMFEIVKQAKNYGIDDSEVRRRILEHTRKYHWLQNNFLSTTYLDEEHFTDVVRIQLAADVDKIRKDNEGRLLEVQKEKEQILDWIEADDELRSIIWLIDEFCYLQDLRKAMDMEANWYTDLFCKEVARRTETDYDVIKFATPVQLREIITEGVVPMEQLQLQAEHTVIIFNDRDDTSEVFAGDQAVRKEKEVLGEQAKEQEVTEIEGMCASVGRYTGIVRKCISAQEAHALQPGEVLVTTMTSPDFVVAMKKAGAIITDQGGITSHAAIVSRELGIPCIIGTGVASKVLQDGDTVEIRANHGVVKIIDSVEDAG